MKKSTAQHIDHEIADFKDRTGHIGNQAKVKVHSPVEEAIRSSGEFQEGVALHDQNEAREKTIRERQEKEEAKNQAKAEAIRDRNYKAYTEGKFDDATYGFLVKVYHNDRDPAKKQLAADALNRKDDKKAREEAAIKKAEDKRNQIQDRNHAALSAFPMKFTLMTFGLVKRLAKKDEKFIEELKANGYKVSDLDCLDAGFEVQRRLQVREAKVKDLMEAIDVYSNRASQLALDSEATGVESLAREAERLNGLVEKMTSELNRLEGVVEAKEEW